MAVKKETESEDEAKFIITNGDLDALNKIKDQYNLKDGSDVIIFAVGLLSQSGGKAVAVERDDGSTVRLLPADELKKPNE
jgi:hypothetical protein